jgi:hypothetical protein
MLPYTCTIPAQGTRIIINVLLIMEKGANIALKYFMV